MLARNVDIMGLTVTKIGDYFTVVANCCSSCVDKEARSPELFEIDIFFESHFCKLRVILRSRVNSIYSCIPHGAKGLASVTPTTAKL